MTSSEIALYIDALFMLVKGQLVHLFDCNYYTNDTLF